MTSISRRNLLKAGAGTAAVTGLALGGAGVAGAAPAGGTGVHIHVTFVDAGGPGDDIKISISAEGRNNKLSGAGWDFDTAPAVGTPSSGACYYTQEGSVHGHTIELSGTVLFSNDPTFLDAPVTTKANLNTGSVTWTFGTFEVTGTGTVVRT